MSKFVKVMYGTTSGAKSDFEYKLGEVNMSNNWNPKVDSGKEFGGFNYSSLKYDKKMPLSLSDTKKNIFFQSIGGDRIDCK